MLRFPLLLAATVLLAAGPAAAQNTCNLNGSGPDQVTLTVPSGGTDFDLGSSGEFHDLRARARSRLWGGSAVRKTRAAQRPPSRSGKRSRRNAATARAIAAFAAAV